MASAEPWKWNLCRACQRAGRKKPKTGSGCTCKITAWRARWRDPSGRPQGKVCRTKSEAAAYGARMEADRNAGVYLDRRQAKERFRVHGERWLATQPHRGSTARSARIHFDRHIYPGLGDRPIGAVTTSEVQALVTKLSRKLAPGTVELIYGRLSSVFGTAVRDRVIPFSPCVKIRLPTASHVVEEVLTTDQVLAIAEAMRAPKTGNYRGEPTWARYYAMVVTGASTGLRPGELLGLTVPAVDFLRREVHVRRQLVTVKGRGRVLTDLLKTDSSRRTIPVAQETLDVLAAHIAAYTPGEEGVIFTSTRGWISETNLRDTWKAARTAAKAPEWATPHDLRHYYASLLIARGLSVKAVQKRLGHKKASTTLDTYAKLWPDSDDETRDAVAGELFRSASPLRHGLQG